jgi:hypothetical protein
MDLCDTRILSGNDSVGRNADDTRMESNVSVYYIFKDGDSGRNFTGTAIIFEMCVLFGIVSGDWLCGISQVAGSVYFLHLEPEANVPADLHSFSADI